MSRKRARFEDEPGGSRPDDDDENAWIAASYFIPNLDAGVQQEELFSVTEPQVVEEPSLAPEVFTAPEPQVDGDHFSVTEPQVVEVSSIPPMVFTAPEPQLHPAFVGSEPEVDSTPWEPEIPPEPNVLPPLPNDNFLEMLLNALLLDDKDREIELEIERQAYTKPDNASKPLYAGAPLNLHESLVSILTLVLTHKLSGVCLKAVLDLISLHLPPVNNFKTSVEFFKKYFGYLQGPTSCEYYCSQCYKKLEKNSPCETCSNGKVCYLVKIPLERQIQTLMARDGFFSKLNSTKHQESATDKIRDIYDGNVYKKFEEKIQPAENECIISAQVYTDGAALYESSKVSAWPVFLSINELPNAQRFKSENILLPAIWCGPVKPLGNILFNAIYPDLLKLSTGITCNIKDIGSKIVKLFIIRGTGDTPARSLMMNMVNFNGEHPCQRCEQKGILREDCVCVRIFPFKPSEMKLRTGLEMIEYGKLGSPENPLKGFRGPSVLTKLMPDLASGMASDPMHQIYGGVGKKIIKLLTTTKKKDSGKWSVSKHYATLDQRLLSIKPPAHTVRMPRSLNDLAFMKMSELKALFLDYLLPMLDGILPSNYMEHLSSLVAAVQLLGADEVSNESIGVARSLLKKFIAQFPDFYDAKYLTINFHLLLHLCDMVEDLGPTWSFTCFPLEALNAVILNLVHGTRWAEKQIATSVQTVLSLPELIKSLPESKVKTYCSNLLNHKTHLNGVVVNGCKIIGSSDYLEEMPADLAEELHGIRYRSIAKFYCLQKGKFVYVALSSSLSVKRDSTVARYIKDNNEEVGIVHYFLRLYKCSCSDKCSCDSALFSVIQRLDIVGHFATLIPDVFVPNTKKYIISSTFHVIPCENLTGVCCRMDYSSKLYISKPCNSREIE